MKNEDFGKLVDEKKRKKLNKRKRNNKQLGCVTFEYFRENQRP